MSIEYCKSSIDFFYLNISIDPEGMLHTTIFRKKTSRNTILRADSFHPSHLIDNVPYGQFNLI